MAALMRLLAGLAFCQADASPRDTHSSQAPSQLTDRPLQRSDHLDESFALVEDMQHAMTAMMGCGSRRGAPSSQDLLTKGTELLPMWTSLPKSRRNRIDQGTMRYLVHRYFLQRYGLVIRGFEPSQLASESISFAFASEHSLGKEIVALFEKVIHTASAPDRGFSLSDVVYTLTAIETFISESDAHMLESVMDSICASFGLPVLGRGTTVGEDGLFHILQGHMARWILQIEQPALARFLGNFSMQEEVPQWFPVVMLAYGEIKAFDYERSHRDQKPDGRGARALGPWYSFEDVHGIVSKITRTFSSWWQSECTHMRDALIRFDHYNMGRVPLKTFYKLAVGGHLHFTESEGALAAIGALDESSAARGKEVIIANYLESIANCVVSTDHYHVCCSSPCDAILRDLEFSVRAPAAPPAAILQALVAHAVVDDGDELEDETPRFEGTLLRKLREIAARYDGSVPIHSRLFRQWLHFAFPRDCSFPHKDKPKVGVNSRNASNEYSGQAAARERLERPSFAGGKTRSDLDWMSLWNQEELWSSDSTSQPAPESMPSSSSALAAVEEAHSTQSGAAPSQRGPLATSWLWLAFSAAVFAVALASIVALKRRVLTRHHGGRHPGISCIGKAPRVEDFWNI